MGRFLVVAIPSRDQSLEDFQLDLKEKTKIDPNISVTEITRLVDNDTSDDCFIVGLLVSDDNGDLDVTKLDPLAEIWVSSSDSLPLAPPYGWNLKTFLCEQGNTTQICNTLSELGLAVIKKGSAQQSEESTVFRQVISMLNDHVANLERTIHEHYPHIKLGESAFGFQEYTHRGPRRFEVLFDPKDPMYIALRDSIEPQIIGAVCQYLDSEASQLRLNISCVYSRPGATDQEWHTDGDHYTGSNRPYAVCVFVPLIPLSESTGYTRFWPKSHAHPNLLGLGQAADALQATVDAIDVKPGDFVMYDYTTWHKGTANTTKDVERPIVQFLYSCDWYKECKNYGEKSVFAV